jgi:hypothetical protein
MRKLFSMMLALLALVSVGCEPSQQGGNDNTGFSFGEPNVTSSSIQVKITPADAAANYYAAIVTAADIADKSDAEIIDEAVNSESFKTRKGTQLIGANNLLPETDYALIAFYITSTDKISRLDITTSKAEAPIAPELFEVDIEVTEITATSAMATATPNSNANRYFFRVITKMELDAMGIYNNDFEVFSYILENPNSNNYIVTGATTLDLHLNPEVDYLAVAFNVENWEAVYNKEQQIKLFRYAFKTPKAEYDPDSLFTYNNLKPTSNGFTVDVIPSRGEDSFWTYYIWTKKSYDDTLAKESSQNIVMRSYWALYNLAGTAFIYDFGQFMRDYMGQTGSSRISNYEPLKGDTDYVVVLFYIDPNVGSDPTEVYEYSYVAIDVHTTERTLPAAELTVSEPVIKANGLKYEIQFNVKLSEDAQSLKIGSQLWANYDFAKYWNPDDWTSIEAFFRYSSKYVSEDSLAEAKSEKGTTISITGVDKGDYVVFFEAENEENTKTQFGVRVTPEMFDQAQ